MEFNKESNERSSEEPRCDTKIWSPACERHDYRAQGDKYLCVSCGKISELTHEIGHDHFPHLKAEDESNLH